MIHRTMEQFLVLDSWVNVTWTCDYRLCLGTKKLLLNIHPSQGHMEEFKTEKDKKQIQNSVVTYNSLGNLL